MRAHIVEEEERLAQSCVLCGERLKGKKLMDHLLKHHLGPLINKKPAVFGERRGGHQEVQLVAVARRHRPARQQPSSGIYQFDNYSCPHCLRKFSAKSGLKIHVGIAHKGGKLLFCPRCPASFADVASCKSHFKEEHSAGRKIKQKVLERESPKRSLVPTNEPVEGIQPIPPSREVEPLDRGEVEEVKSVEQGVGGIRLQEKQSSDAAAKTNKEIEKGNASFLPQKTQTKDASTKTKPRKPIPGLVKIQDLVTSDTVSTIAAPKVKPLVIRKPSTVSKSSFAKINPVPVSTLKPTSSPLQVMTSLVSCSTSSNPITLAPSMGLISTPSIKPSIAAPLTTTTTSQVYVPALTSTGTTILMRLEEAQHHLQRGSVTFLPSAPSASGPPILGQQQQILLAPRTSDQVNIMRDKVALNLPVVMTKRTNKKLAQDNPFFSISVEEEGGLAGECRVCQAKFLFANSTVMEAHYRGQHSQEIRVHAFPLYYEINYRDTDNSKGRMKFFLCFFCGKEFTTKFNVRRHQMLYCPKREEINPRDLGLGKTQGEVEAETEEEMEVGEEDAV